MAKHALPTGIKYELLLTATRTGTCYNPSCSEPLLVTRAGKPIPNFEFAHVRDEQAPSDPDADIGWRYWPDDLTLEQRNHFSNIILLCSPCHRLVDKMDPRSYPVGLLLEWKRLAEGVSGEMLTDTIGSMTVSELTNLLEVAIQTLRPTRDVRAQLTLVVMDGSRGLQMPLEDAASLIAKNPPLQGLPLAVGIEATNFGELSAYVVAFDLELVLPGRPYHPRLSAAPGGANPDLPVELDSGSPVTWLVSMELIRGTVQTHILQLPFTDVVGVVRLATGEVTRSSIVGAENLPIWDDPAAVAKSMQAVRAATAASEG